MSNIFDIRTVKYTDATNDNLICCVCQAPFIDPVTTPCGHTFCFDCIEQALDSSRLCPIDRAPVFMEEVKPAVRIITNMVNELNVHCPEEGCEFIGQRSHIESHIRSQCQYTVTSCDFKECKEQCLKKDLRSHTENCQFRAIECHMCKKKMKAIELEEHFNVCVYKQIECTFCETSRPRLEHADHINECLEYRVKCNYGNFGCPWSGKRKHFSDHFDQCPYVSISGYLINQSYKEKKLNEELRKLKWENTLLKRQQLETESRTEIILGKLTTLFPLHFSSDLDNISDEPLISENMRLTRDIEMLASKVSALELKHNTSLMAESIRTQEEFAGLWAAWDHLRAQMQYMAMGRKLGTNSASIESGVNQKESEGRSAVAESSQSRIRAILDSSSSRADTKL